MNSKRKLLTIIVTLVMLFSCSMLFSACRIQSGTSGSGSSSSSGGSDHVHAYTQTRTEPTCTLEGSILYKCACGDSYSEPLAKLEHNWVSHAEVAATCTENGFTAYKQCSVCNAYENGYEGEVITKLEHDWVSHKEVAATCTKSGFTAYKQCSVCNAYEEGHEGKSISALGHDVSGAACSRCNVQLATGLAYTLSEDGTYYIVSGIGSETRTSFIIPSTYNGLPVKEIGEKAFLGCRDIVEVGLLSGITAIGDNAFWNCESLVRITIPNGVTNIGALAFVWTALEEVILPSTIQSIGEAAFASMLSLKSIVLDGENEYYRAADNCLIDIKTKTLLKGTENSVIPSDGSVTAIGNNAFDYCYGLQSIVIPEGIISIGDDAFFQCSSLESITFPSSLKSIGEQAFCSCKFSEVVIGEGVISVGVRAFSSCYKLKTVIIPESLTYIDHQTFEGCYALEKVIFTGTGEQWLAVDKASNWDNSTGDYTVECLKNSQKDILTFTLSEDESYYIVSGLGSESATSFVIPSTHNGLPVKAIAEKAFYECATVEKIIISDSITDIGGYAFYGCVSLTDIRIPGSVANVGEYAFAGCKFLEEVKILSGVEKIGEYAFSDCVALESITIPGSVTEIGGHAFYGCGALSGVTIDSGVTKLGEYAFAGCTSIMYLTIPSSVATIGEYAFYGCTALTVADLKIGIETSSSSLTTIGEYAFAGCIALESVSIPNSVTTIGAYAYNGCTALNSIYIYKDAAVSFGEYAFAGCTAITSVDLPSGVASIGAHAFDACTKLASVTLPNTLTTIEGYAFNGCTSLASINIASGGALDIGEYAFAGCTAITSVDLPSGVTSIGAHVFDACTKLTSVTLPNTLTTIGGYAFYGCTSLASVTLKKGLTRIGEYAFAGCTALTGIDIPSGVVIIDTHAFDGCTSLSSVTLQKGISGIGTYAFNKCTALTSIVIPSGLETINDYLFYGCTSLSEVSLPASIIYIRNSAFRGCTSLKSIELPKKLKQIYSYAFYKSGLESVLLRPELDSVGKYAFAHCTSLASVTFSTRTDKLDVRAYAFKGCTALTSLTIRRAKIGAGVFKECTGLKKVNILSSVTPIQSDVFLGCTSIESLSLPYIGYSTSAKNYCFLGYLFGAEKYSEGADYIPASLKSIKLTGNSANLSEKTFYGCSNVTSLTVTDGVTTLPKGVFKYLTSLESISLPFVGASASETEASWKTLFGYVFGYSSADRSKTTAVSQYYGFNYYDFTWKTETYHIPNSLKSITLNGNALYGAFSNLTGITSVTLGENAKSIGEYAFYGCTGIKEVHMADIAKWCEIDFCYEDLRTSPLFKTSVSFYYNGSVVTDLVIPEGVTHINAGAFYNRKSITSVTIPSSLKSVDKLAFSGCSGLTKVIASDINRWSEIDFETPTANPLNGGASLYYNGNAVTDLVISDDVIRIGSHAFAGYAALKSVTIPSGLKNVGSAAFDQTGITNVYVTDIEKWTAIDFADASANPLSGGSASLYCNGSLVTALVLPSNVTSIGSYAFYGYDKLTKVTLPASLKTIGASAFDSTSISGVYISDLKAWCEISGLGTFGSCTLYLNNAPISGQLVIPDGVTSLSDYAFYNNTRITSVSFPSGLTSIGSYAFSNCTELTSVSFPSSLTSIGERAFNNCAKLTSVSLPSGFTSIGNYAFSYCTGITSVSLPDGILNIGDYAFCGCSSLAAISIPKGVSIGVYSFIECDALVKVSSPYSLIYDFYAAVELTITSGSYDEYESSQRGTFKNLTTLIIGDEVTSIGGFERQFTAVKTLKIGSGVTDIDSGISSNRKMTISVSENNKNYKTVDGILYTKDGKKLLYYPANKTALSFTVPSGVEDIGYYAFANSDYLQSVTLPDSVKTVGDYAFYDCLIGSIDLGKSVTTIGEEAFYDCSLLKSITIPASVTLIKRNAFRRCDNLKTMTMEASGVWEDPYVWYMTDSLDKTGGTPIAMVADTVVNYFTGTLAEASYYRV